MNQSLEQQIVELEAGLENLKLGKNFILWDDDTPGCKDTGVENFPFCGGRGYKTLRCPFDIGAKVGEGYHDGCYYRCSAPCNERQNTEVFRSSAITKIADVIAEAVLLKELLISWNSPELLETCSRRERDVIFALYKMRRQP